MKVKYGWPAYVNFCGLLNRDTMIVTHELNSCSCRFSDKSFSFPHVDNLLTSCCWTINNKQALFATSEQGRKSKYRIVKSLPLYDLIHFNNCPPLCSRLKFLQTCRMSKLECFQWKGIKLEILSTILFSSEPSLDISARSVLAVNLKIQFQSNVCSVNKAQII